MTIYVNEQGRTIRLNAGFDMSQNTDLAIIFVPPEGEAIEKTTADGVELRDTAVNDPVVGVLAPYRYVEYEAEDDLFDIPGRWSMYLKYINADATPPETHYGDPARFTVKSRQEQLDECTC